MLAAPRHVCELILAFQTYTVTMTVETFLAWTPALRLGKLRQKLPRPPPRLRIHQSRPESRHRPQPLPLVIARRTTRARRPRSPSPRTPKPPSPPPPPPGQRRTVPDLMHTDTDMHMHLRIMEASTAYPTHPLLVRAQIRIPLSKSKRSAAPMPMRALGRSTRFLLIHMERPQAPQPAHLQQVGLKRYLPSRPFGLRR